MYLFLTMKYYSFVVPCNKELFRNSIKMIMNDGFNFTYTNIIFKRYTSCVIFQMDLNVIIETISWTEKMTYVKLNLMRSHGPQNDML